MTSKLQRRAKILEWVNNLDINTIHKKEQEAIFYQLRDFDDKDFISQILIKELNCQDEDRIEKIGYLISEIVDKEAVKEPLWNYIKSPEINDIVKEMSCTLLRIYGEKVRPEDLVQYLENPMEIIDAETKKLLDVALINPEVQIDFLDFLFALPKGERISLVKSLEQDYQGDRLVNILVPILDSSDDLEIREFIIKVLGNSKAHSAVEALENVVDFCEDKALVKLAEIGLKKLKLSGIYYSEEKAHVIDSLACEKSVPYNCYISMPDGLGNQGIIISRLSEDEHVQMFSVVINDVCGIVDCFGFYLLSKAEFERIVDSYNKDSHNVAIPCTFAKEVLLQSEYHTRKNQEALPYEYLAWKSLLYDIGDCQIDLETLAESYSQSMKKVDYELLVDSDVFSLWFFDREDNELVDKFFDEILVPDFCANEDLDVKISALIPNLFDANMIELYRQRLLMLAYLLDAKEEILLRDNIALLAIGMKNLKNPLECELFTWIIRKSVYELFLRERSSFEDMIMIEANIFASKSSKRYESVFSKEKISSIIEELKKSWIE